MTDYAILSSMDKAQEDKTINLILGYGKSYQLKNKFDNHQGKGSILHLTDFNIQFDGSYIPKEILDIITPHIFVQDTSYRTLLEAGNSTIKLVRILRTILYAIRRVDTFEPNNEKFGIFIDNVDGLSAWAIEALISYMQIIERDYSEKIIVYIATNDVYLMNRFELQHIIYSRYYNRRWYVYRPYAIPSIRQWANGFSVGDLYISGVYNVDV